MKALKRLSRFFSWNLAIIILIPLIVVGHLLLGFSLLSDGNIARSINSFVFSGLWFLLLAFVCCFRLPLDRRKSREYKAELLQYYKNESENGLHRG